MVVAELEEVLSLLEARIPANPRSPSNQALARRLQSELAKYFRSLEDAFPFDQIDILYYRYVKESLGSATRDFLDPLLAAFDDTLTFAVDGQIASAYMRGSAEMITWGKTKAGIPIAYEGPPISQAIEWAGKRGAQLVKDMDVETKRRLAQTISQGIEHKRGIPGLASDIRNTFSDMTHYRSRVIARTETANALSQASLDRMKDMGIDGKEWVWPGGECDICAANAAEGIVPVDHIFSSGHSVPPAHPNCECAIAPARLPAQPLVGPSPVSPELPPVGDKTFSSEWARKQVSSASPDEVFAQKVRNQIIREVPAKDLRAANKVIVGNPELRVVLDSYGQGSPQAYRSVSGLFDPNTGNIILSTLHEYSAVTHEFGHAVMKKLPQSAINVVNRSFNASKRSGLGFVSEYSKTNVGEYFAEAYRAYHTTPAILKAKNEPLFNLLNKRYNP